MLPSSKGRPSFQHHHPSLWVNFGLLKVVVAVTVIVVLLFGSNVVWAPSPQSPQSVNDALSSFSSPTSSSPPSSLAAFSSDGFAAASSQALSRIRSWLSPASFTSPSKTALLRGSTSPDRLSLQRVLSHTTITPLDRTKSEEQNFILPTPPPHFLTTSAHRASVRTLIAAARNGGEGGAASGASQVAGAIEAGDNLTNDDGSISVDKIMDFMNTDVHNIANEDMYLDAMYKLQRLSERLIFDEQFAVVVRRQNAARAKEKEKQEKAKAEKEKQERAKREAQAKKQAPPPPAQQGKPPQPQQQQQQQHLRR